MSDIQDWNRKIIEEFRANEGRNNGPYEGAVLLLLTTTGAKSGLKRTAPLGFLQDGERMVVAASMMGAPKHPDWYVNLVKNPEVTVEVGTEKFETRAIVAEGAERERLWALFMEKSPMIAEHQSRTTRVIPLVILAR